MILPSPILARPDAALPDAGELRAAIRRFIGARVSNAATADDLTQEVFVKMLRRITQVRDHRRLMGWLIQIARHTVADHFRRARPTEQFTDEHATSPDLTLQPFAPEETQLRDELSTYVKSVVLALPPIYRDAILLTDYDGLSQVELARELGLTISAAKSRVQRARALVRKTIERCCHFEVDKYGTVVGCAPHDSRCDCAVQRPQPGRVR